MNAPVWFVIDRFSALVGGDGWYRSQLIDSAVRHFDEWWLVGTGRTSHWMATGLSGNINPYSADIVNEFVNQGVRGGLGALIMFIWLLARCFRSIAVAVRFEGRSQSDRFMCWAIGCSMLGHVTSFFSVTYFDQIAVFWYLTIGVSAGLMTASDRAERPTLVIAPRSPYLRSRTQGGDIRGAHVGRRLTQNQYRRRNVSGARRFDSA
jgi:hypothetical protein